MFKKKSLVMLLALFALFGGTTSAFATDVAGTPECPASNGWISESSYYYWQYSQGSCWNYATINDDSISATFRNTGGSVNDAIIVYLQRYSGGNWVDVGHTGKFTDGTDIITQMGGYKTVKFTKEYSSSSLYTNGEKYRLRFSNPNGFTTITTDLWDPM